MTWVRVHAVSRLAGLIARAWIGLVAFDVALRLGFVRVHDRVRRCRVRPRDPTAPATSDAAIEGIVWAVDEACVWYLKRAACLQRSVVTTSLLRRRGVPAHLVIGYRALPFESHAWVEVDDRVVNDRQQYRNLFLVLERL